IEAFGVAQFNALCRENVFTYKTDWEALSERIAYWLDYEHPYITYTPEYIETVWWLLKRLHDKALLYRGHKVLPYCPRCGTALSSHELALGYEEVQTNSWFVTFPLATDPKRQLVVWTTTPWTLLSNVAVAVHPDLEYGEYELDGIRYIAAAARAGDVRVRGRPLSEGSRVAGYRGRDLVGQKYVPPLEVVPLPLEGQRGVVIGGAFVSAAEGPGSGHPAPPFVGRRHPALFYDPRDAWFVRTTAFKARMLEVNAHIGWHPPEVGSGRFGGWLENNVDWALSRDRYWGTPLNIWECDAEREHRE